MPAQRCEVHWRCMCN